MVIFGLFNAMFESTVWPGFTTFNDEVHLGKTFSLVSMGNNITMAIVPLWNGWLHDIAS